MKDYVVSEEAKNVIEQMDLENSLPRLKKWNNYDTGLHFAFFMLSLGLSTEVLSSLTGSNSFGSVMMSIVPVTIISMAWERIVNKTHGEPYTFMPLYEKIRDEAVPQMNAWAYVLNKKENQYALVEMFENLVEYKSNNDSEFYRNNRNDYYKKIARLKQVFQNGVDANKEKLQVRLMDLLYLYREYEFNKGLENFKDKNFKSESPKIEKSREIGK